MTNEVYIVIFTLFFQTADTFSFISAWNNAKNRELVVFHNFFDGQNPLFFSPPLSPSISDSPN